MEIREAAVVTGMQTVAEIAEPYIDSFLSKYIADPRLKAIVKILLGTGVVAVGLSKYLKGRPTLQLGAAVAGTNIGAKGLVELFGLKGAAAPAPAPTPAAAAVPVYVAYKGTEIV